MPWLSTIEIRDGPLGLLGGTFHVPVGTGLTTRDIAFNGSSATLITNARTATLISRLLEQPTQYADVGLGFRAWSFTANLNLNPGVLPVCGARRIPLPNPSAVAVQVALKPVALAPQTKAKGGKR